MSVKRVFDLKKRGDAKSVVFQDSGKPFNLKKKEKKMRFKQKHSYIVLVEVLTIVGLFVMASITLAQGDTWTTSAQVNFTPHEGNPVLGYGPPGSWDAGVVYLPNVIFKDSLYYMFYSGSVNLRTNPFAIGFATSTDGINFTKYASNPIFQADGTGFDAWLVGESVVMLEGDTWVLYYNARAAPGPGPGQFVGRAVASEPSGPWERVNAPILFAGGAGEWDSGFVTPNSVIATDGGYVMYYSGGSNFLSQEPRLIGMATSRDGITWTKYDDPSTTDAPFAESDPVLPLGPPGSWDSGLAWECAVLKTENAWEMFYSGDPDNFTGQVIGYASSTDGINWTKSEQNPILVPTQSWATFELIAPTVFKNHSTYLMWYIGTTTLFDGQIGLATGEVITSVSDRADDLNIPTNFSLSQNYPNPFNPETRIKYELARTGHVGLRVYNMLGQEVRTLVEEVKPAGVYEVLWDGKNNQGQRVASGVYLYKLQTKEFVQTRKMVLLQ